MTQSSNRLSYIDWMRGLACLLMFQTHCYDSWLGPAARETKFFMWSQLLGTLPAPLFLFLAGVSFALVTNKLREKGIAPGAIARTTIRRGAEIFGLGLLFRVQEFVLGQPGAPWTDLLRVDILNIMGLSMMLMGAACRIAPTRARSIATAIGAALGVAMLTPPLWTTWRPRGLPWPLESYLNGVHTFAEPQPWLFPVFPWTALAFAGLAAGFVLFSRGKEKDDAEAQRTQRGAETDQTQDDAETQRPQRSAETDQTQDDAETQSLAEPEERRNDAEARRALRSAETGQTQDDTETQRTQRNAGGQRPNDVVASPRISAPSVPLRRVVSSGERERRVLLSLGAIGVALMALSWWLDALPVQIYAVYDYWHTSPNFFLARVGILLMILAGCHAWCRWGLGQRGFSPIIQLGQSSLLVYWVHISFVYGRFSILPKRAMSIPAASLGLLAIFAAMVLLSVASGRWKERAK